MGWRYAMTRGPAGQFHPTLRLSGGGVAERTIAAVLKTAEVQASGGSNPSPSATLLILGAPTCRVPCAGDRPRRN
jgi:hypothetical protein